MTIPLNSTRQVKALATCDRIRDLLGEQTWAAGRSNSMRSEGAYLAGLLYDSPNEQLGNVIRKAAEEHDLTALRNANLALRHELTVGVC